MSKAAKQYASNGVPRMREQFEKAGSLPKGWASDYFINADQEVVFYAKIPASGEHRGSVVMTTGYNDSVYNFTDTITQWQKRGYDIYAMDWSHQGASQRDAKHPDRPSSRSLDLHVRDLDQFIHNVVQPQAEKPLILSTHSMGGAIGALYMKEHPDTFDKAILAAPMLDLDTSILPRSWFKKIAEVASDVGLKNVSLPNWRDALYKIQNIDLFKHSKANEPKSFSTIFSENARVGFKAYELKLPTWGWVESAYSSMDKINQPGFFNGIKTDILFVAAGHDELVDNRSIHKAGKEAHASVLELPDSQHGVWSGSEKDRATLWRHIDVMLDIPEKSLMTPQKPAKDTIMPFPIPSQLKAPDFCSAFG